MQITYLGTTDESDVAGAFNHGHVLSWPEDVDLHAMRSIWDRRVQDFKGTFAVFCKVSHKVFETALRDPLRTCAS